MDKLTVLREHFGYSSFREGQERLIDAVLAGRDAFGIMPTGGGKSLCYQIPALMLDGVTFVISPLIALMHDQVTALRDAGIPAAYLNSSLSYEQMRTVFANIRAGKYRLVYVAPERLETEGFLRLAQELSVTFLAVDEAHCISQWGQDFRPSYLKIAEFIQVLQKRPTVAAFTATATEEVRRDVVRILELRDPCTVITDFDRPNLRYTVSRAAKKDAELLRLLRERPGKSGIVYCATRKNVENVCSMLCGHGIAATRYHAGLAEEERRQNQEDFVCDRKSVMVATNAFGMGIDKSNVRFVIHYNMPQSPEAYYQEAGRAGRDGEHADCILLYSGADAVTARFLIEHAEENEALSEQERQCVTEMNLKRLQAMIRYCKTTACLRGCLLRYFGQEPAEKCGNCSNCLAQFRERDITQEAGKILSCVKRIENRLHYHVGATLVIAVLRGSGEQRIRKLGLDRLSTYGIMKEHSAAELSLLIEGLEQQGYLYTEPVYRTLRVAESAGEVLFGGKAVSLAVKQAPVPPPERMKKSPGADRTAPEDPALFEALRALRRQIAAEEQIPPYIVFTDATLRDMAAKKPRNEEELLAVSGVGKYKRGKYGRAFLEEIAKYGGRG